MATVWCFGCCRDIHGNESNAVSVNNGITGGSDRERTYLDDDTRTFHTYGDAYNPNQIDQKVTYGGLRQEER